MIGELRTYYQRDWEDVLPKRLCEMVTFVEPKLETVTHVAKLAFPFIGLLYKPAGKSISFISILASGAEVLITEKSITVRTWSILKNGTEFVGTIASLRIGLAVHSVMNLGENFFALCQFKKLSSNQINEKIFSVVSNALYLLTLVSFSTPVAYGVIGASLVFQAAWSLFQARNEFISLLQPPKTITTLLYTEEDRDEINYWREKKLRVVAHIAMAFIYLLEVGRVHEAAWPLWQKQHVS
jgi:hypothetical protein